MGHSATCSTNFLWASWGAVMLAEPCEKFQYAHWLIMYTLVHINLQVNYFSVYKGDDLLHTQKSVLHLVERLHAHWALLFILNKDRVPLYPGSVYSVPYKLSCLQCKQFLCIHQQRSNEDHKEFLQCIYLVQVAVQLYCDVQPFKHEFTTNIIAWHL